MGARIHFYFKTEEEQCCFQWGQHSASSDTNDQSKGLSLNHPALSNRCPVALNYGEVLTAACTLETATDLSCFNWQYELPKLSGIWGNCSFQDWVPRTRRPAWSSTQLHQPCDCPNCIIIILYVFIYLFVYICYPSRPFGCLKATYKLIIQYITIIQSNKKVILLKWIHTEYNLIK